MMILLFNFLWQFTSIKVNVYIKEISNLNSILDISIHYTFLDLDLDIKILFVKSRNKIQSIAIQIKV